MTGAFIRRSDQVQVSSRIGLRHRHSRRDNVLMASFVTLSIFIIARDLLLGDGPVPVGQVLQPPQLAHPLGTDAVGRDGLARVLDASALSIYAAVAVIVASVIIGGVIGAVAGTRGGVVDAVLMRVTDLFLAMPAPVLAIAVAGAFARSFEVTLIAVTVVWWPLYARIIRGEVRALKTRPHVEAARVSGASGASLVLRHMLPGAAAPVLIAVSLDVGLVITTLAGLSFLGLGSPEPNPELGGMVSQGMSYLLNSWWIPIGPAVGVFVLAHLANLAGDGLRDTLGRR